MVALKHVLDPGLFILQSARGTESIAKGIQYKRKLIKRFQNYFSKKEIIFQNIKFQGTKVKTYKDVIKLKFELRTLLGKFNKSEK